MSGGMLGKAGRILESVTGAAAGQGGEGREARIGEGCEARIGTADRKGGLCPPLDRNCGQKRGPLPALG
eukprot:scaffold14566_cov87-Isochrysis_galbana.AAC.2